MAGTSVGTIYAELDLDASRYTKAQHALLRDATQTTLNIEQNFKNLGIKSAAEFDLMRQKIQNSYNMIANSSRATAEDRVRAEQAMHAKLQSLNDQQYGAQESFITKLKANWIAASAAIYAAWNMIGKAWDMAKAGAEYAEQQGILDNLATKYKTTAEEIVGSMEKASDGLVAKADLMQIALAGIGKGLNPQQLIDLADAARILGDAAGKDATTALRDLTEALETGRTKGLKNYLGTALDLEASFGALTSKLTEAEKAQAMHAMTMIAAAEMQAQQIKAVDEGADSIERLEAKYKNINLSVSIFFKELLVGAVEAIPKAIDALGAMAAAEAGIIPPTVEATDVKKEETDATQKLVDKYQAIIDSLKAQLQARNDEKTSVKEVADAYGDLSKSMLKYGEDTAKIAKDFFTDRLKEENATIAEMNKGLDEYLGVLKEVYDMRIAGERLIEEAKKKSGSTPAEVQKTQLEVLKLEKAFMADSLAGWKQFYEALSSQHSKANDLMKQKTQELASLESTVMAQRRSAADQQISLTEKLMMAQGRAANDVEIYNMKRKASEDLLHAAMQQQGEERIKSLEAYKTSQMALTNEVVEYGTKYDVVSRKVVGTQQVVVTQEEAIKKAIENVGYAQLLIADEQEKMIASKKREIDVVQQWKTEIETAMATAKSQMDMYVGQIDAVSKKIAEMEKTIALQVDTEQAVSELIQVKRLWDSLQSKTINLTVNQSGGSGSVDYVGGFLSGGNSGFSDYYGGYSSNSYSGIFTDYVVDTYPGDLEDTPLIQGGYGSHAKGNAFQRGEVIPFARGGVVTRPTYFPMARGMGLMGEAGPEAVMPLARGSDGKLGIAGGQTINFNPSIVIHGANKSAEQLAREIVRPLQAEMRRLQSVGAA